MKQTVGKTVYDFYATKQHEAELGEMLPSETARYFRELHSGLDKGKKRFNKDFFIEMVIKKERLMPQILPRLWAVDRSTCPTPFFDQDCYKYNHKDDSLEFVWSVPSPETCKYLKLNALTLSEPDRELLKFVLDYENGILYRLMKILNNEKFDTPELIKG